MSMSRIPGSRFRRVLSLTAVFVIAGCAAGVAQQAAGGAPEVRVHGAFSNIRTTPEHAYGYVVQLWRVGAQLVGFFKFTEGQQSDFDTGTLDNVEYDAATGKLTYESYNRQFRFSGTLRKKELTGKLTRVYPRAVGSAYRPTTSRSLQAPARSRRCATSRLSRNGTRRRQRSSRAPGRRARRSKQAGRIRRARAPSRRHDSRRRRPRRSQRCRSGMMHELQSRTLAARTITNLMNLVLPVTKSRVTQNSSRPP